MIRAGDLNRRVILEREVEIGRDDFNAPITEWREVAAVSAKVSEELGREFLARGGEVAVSESPAVFLIRWRDDVLLTDRLKYENRTFNIQGMRETGFREGLELKCVEQK